MTASPCDAFVFFGATGDLAYKQVFPALQAMIKHGDLDLPIIGVARSGWNLDQLRDRARDSLQKHGGLDDDAFAKLSARLQYVSGDYPVTCTEVMVQLKPPAPAVFDSAGPCRPNYFRFRLSPDVLISVGARIKVPGEAMVGAATELIAHRHPGDEMSPYERLLGDALHGDAALFTRGDAVEAAWRVVDPILGNAVPVSGYEPATWGPLAAGEIMVSDDQWHNPAPAEESP